MNVLPTSFGRRTTHVEAVAATREAPRSAEPLSIQALDQPAPTAQLRMACLAQLDPVAIANMSVDRVVVEVERVLSEIATVRRFQLNAREQHQLAAELVDDMLGLGPLEPLLEDETITDIMVNGPNRVFVERSGKVVLSDIRFRDASHVANISQRIASAVGRRIDESSPMVDARLKDGSRVNIVFPPLALDGPYISIRKFSRQQIDFAKLISYGSLTQSVARVLEIAGRCRLNVVISGGTGSGKTTLMNAMSRLIDHGERIITIEDAAELQLQQPHVVRMETRPQSLEGRGEVTQRDLIHNALRMRPDRIIVGEVRGSEAFDMLQAMNTGHDGSMSTVHANTTRDAVTRIENMVQMGNMGLPSRSIRQQFVGAVDLIVQVERHRDGKRRITQVTDVCGLEGDTVILNDIFLYQVEGETLAGGLVGRYRINRARPSFHQRLSYFGLDRAWGAALEDTELVTPMLSLLIGGCCVSGGVAIGVSAIMGEQKRRRRFQERLLKVAGSHMRANPLAVMGRDTATRSARTVSLIAAAARLFGYDPTHAEHYSLRWWVVLSIALVLARALSEMLRIFVGSWSLLIVPVIWVMLSRYAFHWSERRRRDKLYAQFPDALAMIVRAVRVGIPLSEGIHTVAREAMPPTGPEFGLLYDRVSIGITLEDALREMAERNKLAEYRFFATALALQSRTGGGLSEALEGLADVMRRRLALKARGLALAAEAKTSIMILASLPFVSGGALGVINPRYIGRLFTDPGCQKVLIAAIGLLGGGLLVMRGMIRKALS